jgi:hypothetical protein
MPITSKLTTTINSRTLTQPMKFLGAVDEVAWWRRLLGPWCRWRGHRLYEHARWTPLESVFVACNRCGNCYEPEWREWITKWEGLRKERVAMSSINFDRGMH